LELIAKQPGSSSLLWAERQKIIPELHFSQDLAEAAVLEQKFTTSPINSVRIDNKMEEENYYDRS